ncbi:hypothetical protein F941_02733 [Acinetobacter bouvetii DSM 14964 = CIP 107468]|uniref:Big-1 domain-containing protein n=1 Tax=Acinetobacter bouvetii DSM 14964 = CIP 107468 TaxID=1120925 RepID=N9C7Y0_9GAMM|nr:Ig-like domain-containing protein [Acinetobacter bouvetii]ENV81591.1 hypothetical protein F941_02733 [Acinetobacter bouvetii DSM 14964 = CIP 107468]BCU63672.1 hypothetical protein ACBO_04630 [Acinetobacter bouvetii]
MEKKQIGLKLSAVALAVLLASCGGGGSEGYYNQQSSGSTGSSNNPNTGEAVKSLNASAIQLKNLNGNSTAVITAEGVTATVKVTDQSGNGVSGAIVTFTSTGGVTFGSSNGAVVTNANGEATISVTPENLSSTGAYKISASAEFDGNTATAKDAVFSLQSLNVVLANISAAAASLSSGASTNITLKTLNQDSDAQNNVTVNFTASCGTFDPASVISSNQGNVITSYKAIASNGDLCEGPVVVTASSPSSSSSVTTTLNIAAVAADSLVYTTTADVNLGIKNSGSAASSSIEFTLYANGVPARDKNVEVSLEKAPNDLHFVTLNNRSTQTLKSDSKGKIVVNLYPGNIPGPVEIKATLVASPTVSAISKGVKVSSGRVTQNGVSLSVSKQSLRTDIDGDVATIVARMRDRTGNPVPKDTVISFVSEGGKVDSNCMTDDKGVCSVTLTTQSPRPLDNRVTVLAYVEGDKSYIDNNGDNLYTAGTDTLTDNIGDFFKDDNEDNLHSVGEFIYQKAAGALQCAISSFAQPNIPNTCDSGLSAVLRQQLVFSFAHDTPTFVWNAGFDSNGFITSGSGNFSFQVFGNSQKTVPMPSGTTISVAVKDNSDFQPKAKLQLDTADSTKQILKVSGAEPNTTLIVTINDIDYAVIIDSTGTGSKGGIASTVTGTPEITYKNLSCEAEIRSGNLTVPNTMALLTPSTFANNGNDLVDYTVRLKGCTAGDDVKIISSVPGGKSLTSWLDIK